MKDDFKRMGFTVLGVGGIKCPCCSNGYQKRECNSYEKGIFSRVRRRKLKQLDIKEHKDLFLREF